MRGACLQLEQSSRSVYRLRGLVSDGLHRLFAKSYVALEGVLGLRKTNWITFFGVPSRTRQQTRRITRSYTAWTPPNVLICVVARATGQVLKSSLIRTRWCCSVADVPHEVRCRVLKSPSPPSDRAHRGAGIFSNIPLTEGRIAP